MSCQKNPSCTKVLGTHTFYEGGGGGGGGVEPTKTIDSTSFNFGRPLGLSMRGRKPVELFAHDELESRRACQSSGKQEDFNTSVRSQEEFTT